MLEVPPPFASAKPSCLSCQSPYCPFRCCFDVQDLPMGAPRSRTGYVDATLGRRCRSWSACLALAPPIDSPWSTRLTHDRNFERHLHQPLHHGVRRCRNHPSRSRSRPSRRVRHQGGRPNAGFAPLRPHGTQLPVNQCVVSLPSISALLADPCVLGSRRRCSPSRSLTWSV